jgi:acetylornithine deacetylase/succinyl-diaminopimelate desuccinylase-like protein
MSTEVATEPEELPGEELPLATAGLEEEALEFLSALIAIDTSNYGDGSGPGERAAAEYTAERLSDAGLDPVYLEGAPRRGNVVLRIPGRDRSLPALLVHGHLDTVPADRAEWADDPWSGELRDGVVHGRGAVDMKDMDAVMLALARAYGRGTLPPPRRDLVFAWLADEEAGSDHGSRFLVRGHRELFDGCTEAIGEVGGFSVEAPASRLYLIETAQKGMHWMRLVAEGAAGHGSMLQQDNAVAALAGAVADLAAHPWPVVLTPTSARFLAEVADAFGVDAADPAAVMRALGPLARFAGAALTHTANPTRLTAGYKTNVVPGRAEAEVDGRFVAGGEPEFLRTIDAILDGRARRETLEHDIAVEEPFEGELITAISAALRAEDPAARPVPYTMAAGTDNKTFHAAGLRCYGFVPRRLPPGLDFASLFHGADERVPESSVRFTARVLRSLLAEY